MINIWEFLKENVGALGLLIALGAFVWPVLQYLSQKRQELRSERFETYHKLIKQLVEREEAEKPMMLDRQLAVVFELRRFNEHFEPTLRILKGLRSSWKDNYGPEDKRIRLVDEMDTTILFIETKYNRWFRIPVRAVQKL